MLTLIANVLAMIRACSKTKTTCLLSVPMAKLVVSCRWTSIRPALERCNAAVTIQLYEQPFVVDGEHRTIVPEDVNHIRSAPLVRRCGWPEKGDNLLTRHTFEYVSREKVGQHISAITTR